MHHWKVDDVGLSIQISSNSLFTASSLRTWDTQSETTSSNHMPIGEFLLNVFDQAIGTYTFRRPTSKGTFMFVTVYVIDPTVHRLRSLLHRIVSLDIVLSIPFHRFRLFTHTCTLRCSLASSISHLGCSGSNLNGKGTYGVTIKRGVKGTYERLYN